MRGTVLLTVCKGVDFFFNCKPVKYYMLIKKFSVIVIKIIIITIINDYNGKGLVETKQGYLSLRKCVPPILRLFRN